MGIPNLSQSNHRYELWNWHDEGMADNSTKIAALEAAIATGAKSVLVDGQKVEYRSLSDMQRILRNLKATDDSATTSKRPRVMRVVL